MAKSTKHTMLLLKMAIKPIARLLIRNHIDCRQFIEAAKQAFVEAATEEYGIRERPTNISRTAIICGLTRKEVTRIRKLDSEEAQAAAYPDNLIAKIVNGWLSDTDYLTRKKTPKSVPFDNADISFQELVRRYGGDMPPGAVRTELIRQGLLEIGHSGRLRLTAKNGARRKSLFQEALRMVRHSTAAIDNFDDDADRWPIEFIKAEDINEEDLAALRRIVSKEFEALSRKIREVLRAYRTIGRADTPRNETNWNIHLMMTHTELP